MTLADAHRMLNASFDQQIIPAEEGGDDRAGRSGTSSAMFEGEGGREELAESKLAANPGGGERRKFINSFSDLSDIDYSERSWRRHHRLCDETP